MKAAVWTGINQIEVKEVPMPVIGQEEALIKVPPTMWSFSR